MKLYPLIHVMFRDDAEDASFILATVAGIPQTDRLALFDALCDELAKRGIDTRAFALNLSDAVLCGPVEVIAAAEALAASIAEQHADLVGAAAVRVAS